MPLLSWLMAMDFLAYFSGSRYGGIVLALTWGLMHIVSKGSAVVGCYPLLPDFYTVRLI